MFNKNTHVLKVRAHDRDSEVCSETSQNLCCSEQKIDKSILVALRHPSGGDATCRDILFLDNEKTSDLLNAFDYRVYMCVKELA